MELLPLSAVAIIVTTLIRFVYRYLTRKSDVQVSSDIHAMKYLHNQLLFKDDKIERLLKELNEVRNNLSEQKRLVAILESTDWEVPCPYWVRNTDHEFVHANLLYLKFFNFKEESIIGKKDFEVFPKDIVDRFRSTDNEVLKGNRDVVIDEYEGSLIIKWKQSAGRVTIGIAGIVIPSGTLDKNTILKLINYGEDRREGQ
jgi:PAS domain-containing protein